jgi:hypothetical protein
MLTRLDGILQYLVHCLKFLVFWSVQHDYEGPNETQCATKPPQVTQFLVEQKRRENGPVSSG